MGKYPYRPVIGQPYAPTCTPHEMADHLRLAADLGVYVGEDQSVVVDMSMYTEEAREVLCTFFRVNGFGAMR